MPSTPAITGTPAGLVIAYTAASLKGASAKLGPAFEKAYPGTQVIFDLDGTQILKHQVESGAYTDVFISASNTYTKALTDEGYFIAGTVKPLTSNYIIVILPAKNPGNIQSLADIGVPGKRLAMGTADVPIGMNTRIVIDRLANSTYGSAWKDQVYKNVKTYETTEPGVVTKVSLGEVDAGFVYESSYKAAKNGTLLAINIPEKDNALQTYSVAVMKISTNKPTAMAFENFLLSPAGQQILSDFGFRPVS
jgi:molybdate transport system substrate-binding protein